MVNSVMACIMAYYPGDEFESVCSTIAGQVKLLLIIDNSAEGNLAAEGRSFSENTIIVTNNNNGAVSGALNIALEYARSNGFDYLHIFDQDTIPPADITKRLLKSFESKPSAAIISPRFLNSNSNFPGRVLTGVNKWIVKSYWPKTDIGLLEVLFTISSASLINIKKLPPNSFYDTRLVVDNCDVDFCLALRAEGLEIFVDTSICIVHGLGARKKGGGRFSATNYSPLRKQLSAKNRMIIWRRYWGNYPGYILNDLLVFVLDSGRTIVFEKQRFAKIMALSKGLLQGLKEKNIMHRTGVN